MSLTAHVPARRVEVMAMLLALVLIAPISAGAAPAQAPGSRIVLDLPEGFAASPNFSGFAHVSNGATILLLEVPASAYPVMARGLNAEVLSRKGVNQVQTGTLNREGEYIYVTGEQSTASGAYAKYIMLFQNPPVAALISISVPKSAIGDGSAEPATFEQILSTARIDPDAGTKPFVLSYTGPFRDTGAFIGQSHFYAIEDRPANKGEPPGQPPTLTVAAALDSPRIDDLEATGRAGITSVAGGQERENIESQPLQVAGLDGIEHVAPPTGTGSETGIYQVILRGRQGGYYRIVGQAPSGEWQALLPEFRKIAQSFAPRP